MTKKTLFILVFVLLSVALALPTMAARSDVEKKAKEQADLINDFGMPQHKLETFAGENGQRFRDIEALRAPRATLGAAAATPGNGVGEVIDNTYNDLQRYVNQGRNVEHSVDAFGNVDVHFVYEDFQDVNARWDDTLFASPNKTGYNFWDAMDSTWPWGQEAGCLIQAGDSVIGTDGHLDIMPNGLVVICSRDNYTAESEAGGWIDASDSTYVALNNHFYWQESRHSCFFDTGGLGSNSNHVTEAVFLPGTLGSDPLYDEGNSNNPIIATQVIGNDTITHVAMQETPGINHPGAMVGEPEYVLKYWRKLGSGYSGTWDEEMIIDTVAKLSYPCMAASPHSAKVSIAWNNTSPYGHTQDQFYDQDVYLRKSNNGGIDWDPVENFTNHVRDTNSMTALIEVNTVYDALDRLHLIYGAGPTSENPYRDGYFWGDFSDNIYHLCYEIGVISKVAHGAYGISANSATCGMGSPGAGYIAFYSISECDGNLYVVWDQIHRHTYELGLAFTDYDDCSTDAMRIIRANWEMYVTVSSTLDGLLWDAARNLTDTYTPGCDSALGDSGACGSEYKPSMEKYGLNESGLGLRWPGKALVDPDTIAYGIDSAYDGDYFLNVMYLDDEYPGSWYYTGGSTGRRNDVPRLNAMKWLRVACVDPIQAPQISAAPRSVSWTDELAWVKNGETKNITVTVTNDGNMALDVYEIATVETSGSGWLGTSAPTMNVPAGIPNTGTFDVQIDASALTFGLGNSSWLDGEILLISDAGNFDTLVLSVHILAADTVEPTLWDIAATSAAWDPEKGGPSAAGDNTALSVSNWGEIGHFGMNGDMESNLDYSMDGGECRTDDRGKIYAWSGSPYIIQHDGGGSNLRITTSFNLNDQAPEHSFDPLVNAQGITGGVSGGGEYDSVFTGAFANRDTSLILERTFFAPRNNPDNPSFVVCKTVMYSGDGQAHDNITIGSFTDWDVPSVVSPENTVGASSPSSPAGQFVYVQGTHVDTSEAPLICQENTNRFGAELFLDWHTNAEYNLDDCAANDTSWGSWGASQLISDDEGAGVPDVQEWYDSLSSRNGYFANDTSIDQSIWVTYLMDHSLGATDTLTFYSLYATLHDGSLSTFEGNLVDAKSWYLTTIRGAACATCCVGGTMGNIDCTGIIDIGDVTVMISNLFITLKDPCCIDEADLDVSGLVDIGDLTMLISSLFITLRDLDGCP